VRELRASCAVFSTRSSAPLRLSAEQRSEYICKWQQATRRSGALGEILDSATSAAAHLDEGRLQREIDDRGVRRSGDD
jgi:hypothetical protein